MSERYKIFLYFPELVHILTYLSPHLVDEVEDDDDDDDLNEMNMFTLSMHLLEYIQFEEGEDYS